MLDCHIIVSPDTPREWVTQCLDSVHAAADRAGYPVAVHVVDGVPGHIGKARSTGYALGTESYVTCVDDDDWVEPDTFACLFPAMQSGAPAIYTMATQWQNGKPSKHNLRQSLRAFRRDVVASFDFNPWPACDSSALIAHADAFGPSIELLDRVYNYRIEPKSKARQIIANTQGLSERANDLGNIHGVRHG